MTDNARGAGLMILAMATFAVEDAFLKLSASAMPIGQILLASGMFGAAVFWVIAARRGLAVITPLALHPAVLWRNAGEVTGTLAYITALASVPLATVSAVLQAMPLAVTLGAALFMDERVGWRSVSRASWWCCAHGQTAGIRRRFGSWSRWPRWRCATSPRAGYRRRRRTCRCRSGGFFRSPHLALA
jgi:hypothetical protein